MAHHPIKLPACANCSYSFPPEGPDEYCPRCGQQNHEVNISFGHVLEEMLEGLFHFDGKVFRTARLLLFRPGQLTRKFLEGNRVPYVPPIRLYIFISFVFFFLLSVLATPHSGKKKELKKVAEEMTSNMNDKASQSLEKQLAALPKGQRDSVRHQLDSLRRLPVVQRLQSAGVMPTDTVTRRNTGFNMKMGEVKMSAEDLAGLPEEPSSAQIDSVIRSKGLTPGFFNRLSVKRLSRWRDVTQEDAVHQVYRGLSVLMFVLMPLAALLLKGVYFRQRRHYITHLIFTIHIHCFLFVFVSLLLLLGTIPWGWVDTLTDFALLLPPIYFIVALHNFYQQSWGKTLAKAMLLSMSYALVMVFSTALVAIIGFAMF